MDSLTWKYLTIVIAIFASITVTCSIQCSPTNELFCKTRRFKSTPAAIDYLYSRLAYDTPLEEKCKRYAVLLSMASDIGLPYEADGFEVLTLEGPTLDKLYQVEDINIVAQSYMFAIEGYRVRQLAPAFLELIECLKTLGTHKKVQTAMTYLNDTELRLIVDLYMQILGFPARIVNLHTIDLSKFRTSFRLNLQNLFSDYLPSGQFGALNAREQRDYRRRQSARLKHQRLYKLDPDKVREEARVRYKRRRDQLRQSAQGNQHTQESDIMPSRRQPTSEPMTPAPDPETARKARRRRQDLLRQKQAAEKQQKLLELQQMALQRKNLNLDDKSEPSHLKHMMRRLQHRPDAVTTGEQAPETSAPSSQVAAPQSDGDGLMDVQQVPLDGPLAPSYDVDYQASPSLAATFTHLPAIGDQTMEGLLNNFDYSEQDAYMQDPCQQYDHVIDSMDDREFDDLINNWLLFEPESQEELETYDDLIRCSSQPDDTDRVMQMLSDHPESVVPRLPSGGPKIN